MRILVALAIAVALLAGVAAPHHHVGPSGEHECLACTVGSGLEARDETPPVVPAVTVGVASAVEPVSVAASGAPLGAVPGQSPPRA